MDEERIMELKSKTYGQELAKEMAGFSTIMRAVNESRRTLKLIGENQIWSLLRRRPNLTPAQVRKEMTEITELFLKDLDGWDEEEDEQLRLTEVASIVAKEALIPDEAETMYIALAELRPELTKTYDLLWCVEESTTFRRRRAEMEKWMPESQAESTIREMVIEHVKTL